MHGKIKEFLAWRGLATGNASVPDGTPGETPRDRRKPPAASPRQEANAHPRSCNREFKN